MGVMLTGNQLRKIYKKLGEINRQLSQAKYPLDFATLYVTLNALINGTVDQVTHIFPSELLASELIPSDSYGEWQIVSDGLPELDDIDPSNVFQLDLFLPGENSLSFFKCKERALRKGHDYTLADAKTLLGESGVGADISPELQGKCILFTGTVLVMRSTVSVIRYIPYLKYTKDKIWGIHFFQEEAVIRKCDGYILIEP